VASDAASTLQLRAAIDKERMNILDVSVLDVSFIMLAPKRLVANSGRERINL
jgi:hypothetical protein